MYQRFHVQNWSTALCRETSSSTKDAPTAASDNGVGSKTIKKPGHNLDLPLIKCCYDEWGRCHQWHQGQDCLVSSEGRYLNYSSLQGHLGNMGQPCHFKPQCSHIRTSKRTMLMNSFIVNTTLQEGSRRDEICFFCLCLLLSKMSG